MKRIAALLTLWCAHALVAQTINPNQIRPGTANSQVLTTVTAGQAPSWQTPPIAGVSSAQGTAPIQVNGVSGTPETGALTVSCPTCGNLLQMAISGLPAGQHAVLYASVKGTCTTTGSSSACSNFATGTTWGGDTGASGATQACGPTGALAPCSSVATVSNFGPLPPGWSLGHITAEYLVEITQNAGPAQFYIQCTHAGGPGTPAPQSTSLTTFVTAYGSVIDPTAESCQMNMAKTGGDSRVSTANTPVVAIVAFDATDPAPPAGGSTLFVQAPLNYNALLNTLSLTSPYDAGIDFGSANAYQVVIPLLVNGLSAGDKMTLIPAHTNTGSSTVAVTNAGFNPGIFSILKWSGGLLVSLTGGELPANEPSPLIFDGAEWVLQTSIQGGGGDAITSPGGTLSVGGTSVATTLDLNLAHANTWTALQGFSAGINLPGTTAPLQFGGSAGTAGQCPISGGAGATPSWGSCGSGGGLPSATAPGQMIASTAAGTTYAVQSNVFYSQSGDTISSIETECSAPCTYFVTQPQTITLTASHSLAANVNLVFLADGIWTVNGSTFTLTISGNMQGDLHQHFKDVTSGGGTGSVAFGASQAQLYAEWFGAVGDWNGTTGTDNTNAINDCIASIGNGGGAGVCVLQALPYKVTNTIVINKAGEGLVGSPQAQGTNGVVAFSELVSTSATADIIDIGTSSGFIAGNTLKHLYVKRSVAVTSTTVAGVSLTKTDNINMEDIVAYDSARNFYFSAASFGPITRLLSESCSFVSPGAGVTSVYGFYIDGEQDSLYGNTWFAGSTCGSQTTYGFYFNGTIDAALDHMETAGVNYAVYLNGTNNVQVRHVVADQTKTTAIYATGGFSSTSVISGRLDDPSSSTYAIDVESATNLLITDMTIFNSYTNADVLIHSSSGINFVGNVVNGCGGSGLCVSLNGANDNNITGNTLNSTSTGLQLVGSSFNQIGGNQFGNGQGGSTAIITLDATSNHNHWANNNAFFTTTGTLISDSGTDNQFLQVVGSSGTVTYTASQTASAADNNKLVIMNCSAACSYTLPATQPSTTWAISLQTVGSTTATVVLGGSDTYNGSTSVPVLLNDDVLPIWANTATSTDYKGGTPLVAGTNVTITNASNGKTVAASGGGGGSGAITNITASGSLTWTNCTVSGTVCATTGSVASVSVSGLGTACSGNRLRFEMVPIDATSGQSAFGMELNGDTTTGDYVWENILNNVGANNTAYFRIGVIGDSTTAGLTYVDIQNFGSSLPKNIRTDSTSTTTTTAADQGYGGTWFKSGNPAVTSALFLDPTPHNIASGSTFIAYCVN